MCGVIIQTGEGNIEQQEARRIAELAVKTIVSKLPERVRTYAMVKHILKEAEIAVNELKVNV